MLPAGFHFERYIDGPGLYLGDRVVATASPANYDPDTPWRVCMIPAGRPTYHFTATEAGAARYMAAWARKWEYEIREAAGRVGSGVEHLRSSGAEPVTTTHTRHRSRRRPRISP